MYNEKQVKPTNHEPSDNKVDKDWPTTSSSKLSFSFRCHFCKFKNTSLTVTASYCLNVYFSTAKLSQELSSVFQETLGGVTYWENRWCLTSLSVSQSTRKSIVWVTDEKGTMKGTPDCLWSLPLLSVCAALLRLSYRYLWTAPHTASSFSNPL